MMQVYYCIKCKKYFYTNNQSRAVCCGSPMYHVDVREKSSPPKDWF